LRSEIQLKIASKKGSLHYLSSILLDKIPWVNHAFGIKGESTGNKINTLGDFVKSFGLFPEFISEVDQIHSSKVFIVSKPGIAGRGDGLVTNKKGLILAVKTADCAPALFCDTKKRVIGAVHIGWRGIVKGIIEKFADVVVKEFGSKMDEIFCAVGPFIRECCYEIGDDIIGYFKHYYQLENGKIFLNMEEEIKDRLLRVGIPVDNIEFLKHCTACDPEKFFSYRRDRGKTGRMYSIIMINN